MSMTSQQVIAAGLKAKAEKKADTINWIAGHFEATKAKIAAAPDCTPELIAKAEARCAAFLAHAESKPHTFFADLAAPNAMRELAKDYTGP